MGSLSAIKTKTGLEPHSRKSRPKILRTFSVFFFVVCFCAGGIGPNFCLGIREVLRLCDGAFVGVRWSVVLREGLM